MGFLSPVGQMGKPRPVQVQSQSEEGLGLDLRSGAPCAVLFLLRRPVFSCPWRLLCSRIFIVTWRCSRESWPHFSGLLWGGGQGQDLHRRPCVLPILWGRPLGWPRVLASQQNTGQIESSLAWAHPALSEPPGVVMRTK